MTFGYPSIAASYKRCVVCEVGEYSTSWTCWNCGGTYQRGNITDLKPFIRGVVPRAAPVDPVNSWQIHEENPTLERSR